LWSWLLDRVGLCRTEQGRAEASGARAPTATIYGGAATAANTAPAVDASVRSWTGALHGGDHNFRNDDDVKR